MTFDVIIQQISSLEEFDRKEDILFHLRQANYQEARDLAQKLERETQASNLYHPQGVYIKSPTQKSVIYAQIETWIDDAIELEKLK